MEADRGCYSMLYLLSSCHASSDFVQVPEIQEILQNSQQATNEERHKICMLAVSSSFEVEIILHSVSIQFIYVLLLFFFCHLANCLTKLDAETNRYYHERITCRDLNNPTKIQIALRQFPSYHYDLVVPIFPAQACLAISVVLLHF